ncbi:MAG: type II toxin-antitoxin system RelE/ParE family toxin [Clostridiaceae bacterium]|nr:type II toxin-antitoxin system RelE/ParE family toxin [Clostridiaceae bacterium]
MQIQYETKAIKDLKSIDAKARKQIIAKIVQYADVPASLTNNVTRLVGSPFYRLRVGDYRVIFSLDGEVATVMTIIRVRHRREAYD